MIALLQIVSSALGVALIVWGIVHSLDGNQPFGKTLVYDGVMILLLTIALSQ